MQRRAFTLIELLVSIAIIGLLIAVLVPSLSRARQTAKRTLCGSNLRGLMQAVYLYANDHKERLVTVGLSHGGAANEHAAWINSLSSYYGGNPGIARCPADESEHWEVPIVPSNNAGNTEPESNGSPPGASSPLNKPVLRRTSYGTNYYTAGKVGKRDPFNKIGLIKRPNSTILFVELIEVGPFATSDHVHPETWWINPRPLASEEMALERHVRTANYGFFDGHAASHRFEDTFALDESRSSRRKLVWKRNYYDPDIAR